MNISNQDYHIRMLADLAAQNHEALIIASGLSPELICESIPSVIRKKGEKKNGET